MGNQANWLSLLQHVRGCSDCVNSSTIFLTLMCSGTPSSWHDKMCFLHMFTHKGATHTVLPVHVA